MNVFQIQKPIVQFLKSLNNVISEDDPQLNTTDLFNNNILDSLGVFQLIAFIESQFEVSIKPNELILENFKTIARITEMIQEKQSANLHAE